MTLSIVLGFDDKSSKGRSQSLTQVYSDKDLQSIPFLLKH